MNKRMAASLALAVFAVGSRSGEPAFLAAEELNSLIVGHTIEARQQGAAGTFRVYFDPNGQRLALQPDGEYALPWRILPDGTQCVTTGTGDDCARVLRNYDGTYSRIRDGIVVTTWLQILPGKTLGSLSPDVYARQPGPNQYLLTPPAERRPQPQAAEESRRVPEEIRIRTEAYFNLLSDGRVDEAYAQVDTEGIGKDAAGWKSWKQSFRTLTGSPVHLSISKITVYDSPAQASQPGLYVAADYFNEYQDVPVHCGYLMWFRPAGGEFRIIREETAFVTAKDLKAGPAMDISEIKRHLQCPAR